MLAWVLGAFAWVLLLLGLQFVYGQVTHPWAVWMHVHGLAVSNGMMTWSTERHLRWLLSWVRPRRSLVRKWFVLGSAATLVLIPCSLYLLWTNLTANLHYVWAWLTSATPDTDAYAPVLQPLLPGVNLPRFDLVYIFVALLVNAVVHEAGHAMAAVSEGIPIGKAGVFVMLVYPGAFVELDRAAEGLGRWSRLRVFGAGAWHNLVLACVAFLLLQASFLPYEDVSEHGVSVESVHPGSVLEGALKPCDTLVELNGCATRGSTAFYGCLQRVCGQRAAETRQFCVDGAQLRQWGVAGDQEHPCCDADSRRRLECYADTQATQYGSAVCLGAKHTLAPSACEVCQAAGKRCIAMQLEGTGVSNQSARYVVRVQDQGKSRVEHGDGTTSTRTLVVFGTCSDLVGVTVSDFRGRSQFACSARVRAWIDVAQNQLRYMVSLGLGLAVLNVCPTYMLDGEWCVRSLGMLGFTKRAQRLILGLGSSLFVANLISMVLGVWVA